MVLAIETATHVCSVALGHSYKDSCELRTEQHGGHSERLFEFIQNLLEEKSISLEDLQAVVVSAGPGSYTGLRIAASGLKGLLFGLKPEIFLYAADTLAAFAFGALLESESTKNTAAGTGTESTIHAVIDARRKHLYYRAFNIRENQQLLSTQKAEVVELANINTNIQPGDIVVGTGIERLDSEITSADTILTFGEKAISARALLALYDRIVEHPQSPNAPQTYITKTLPEQFIPRYLR